MLFFGFYPETVSQSLKGQSYKIKKCGRKRDYIEQYADDCSIAEIWKIFEHLKGAWHEIEMG